MRARRKPWPPDARGTRGLRSAEREFRKVIGNPRAFAAAIDTAAVLMRQVRSRSPRRGWKPVTLQQVLKSVVTVLVCHLSSFEYRKRPRSAQARTARMLAALTVRLADTVIPRRVRRAAGVH
jgi:hypothetical protein